MLSYNGELIYMNLKKGIIIFSVLMMSISFCLPSSIFASNLTQSDETDLHFPKLRLIRIDYSESNMDFVHQHGLDQLGINVNDWIDLIVDDEEIRLLNSENIEYSTRIEDVHQHSNNVRGEYHTFPEMVQMLEDIADDYPDITSLYSIGKSWEGRDIWCLEISDNPGVDEGEPGVFYMGLHHAREWPTIEICLHIADELTSKYGSDPDITDVVNNRRLWIVPCENPDGYVYSHDQGHTMWRKNRRPLPEFGTYGIDPNRNYGGSSNGDPWGSWGSIGEGSVAHDPDDDTYCGPWPMSENCTQAIKDFYIQNDICASISWHTYSEYVMWPWGYSQSEITPDNTYISQVGTEIASRITEQDGTGTYLPMQSSSLYPTTGDTTDWAYGYKYYVQGQPHFAYTIEACSSFQPSESYLDQICEENFDGALYLLQEAENISNTVIPQVMPPEIDEMATDDDGDYTVSWTEQNPIANPDYFQLDELTGLTISTDDAESGITLWDIDGFSLSTTRSYSSSHSFKSRHSNEDVSAMTTVNPLPVSDGMSLCFWTWYEIEENYDMGFVEVSNDGRSFTLLDMFTGDSGGWTYHEYSLDDWTDQSLFIRFRYTTDSWTQDEGFYVDDINPIADFSVVSTLSDSITGNSYAITGNDPGVYYYRVKGHNVERDWGDFSMLQSMNVTSVGDEIGIENISASPRVQDFPGWVNITCDVLSDNPTNDVKVDIKLPDGSHFNQSMSKLNPQNRYYFNSTFIESGIYDYSIWVEDTNSNQKTSYCFHFYIGTGYIDIALNQGWNLLTVPVDTNMYAGDLANNITGCVSVSRWDGVNQTYDSYVVGFPESDFVLVDGFGYFVDVDQGSVLSLVGPPVLSVGVPLNVGWNMIGWYHEDVTSASSIAENISGCGLVSRWDGVNQSFDSYVVGFPESDFTVTCGMGLFVDVSTDSTWYGEG